MLKILYKEKILEIIKNIFIIFFIAIVIIGNMFGTSYTNLDELWNFNFARNIANGLVPYRDFNMIQTPLVAIICSAFLKVFGSELIVMRIIAVILLTTIFFMAYLIIKKLTNKSVAMLGLMGFLLLFKDILCIDYNYAVLLVALIIIYIELKQQEELFLKYSFKYNLFIGILSGISILFKQTTGIAIAAACVGYKVFKIRSKEEVLEFVKIAITRLIGIFIPVFCFIIYLIVNNAFTGFMDYAILGVSTFTNKILYKNLFGDGIISILAILLPIIMIVMFVLVFLKQTKREVYILFAYSIASSVVVYPISDKIHFCIGGMATFISGIYLLFNWLCTEELFDDWSKITKMALYGIFSFILMFMLLLNVFNSIEKFTNQYIKVNKEGELSHFIGIPENTGLKERILEIQNFILQNKEVGKKVYILDAEAALYMIPLDIYNKDYDMFLKGNLGKEGEAGIIDRIKKEEKVIYLIKQSGLNWQNPDNVRNYVVNNLNFTGAISIFWVFEK